MTRAAVSVLQAALRSSSLGRNEILRRSFGSPLRSSVLSMAAKGYPSIRMYSTRVVTTAQIPEVVVDAPQDTDCRVEPKLTQLESRRVQDVKDLVLVYLHLGKHRLASLVVFTTFVGYYMGGAVSVPNALLIVIGTFMQAASANGYNQVIERNVDGLMKRTCRRPLVVGAISVPQAIVMLGASGIIGSAILYYAANPLTCYLGVATWVTYVLMYTPMKRMHWLNTWVGAVVGMLPPMMGAAASLGGLDITGWYLGGLLFLWQMPHFLSLSYLCRKEYASAGFHMLPSIDELRASYYSFTHTVALSAWSLIALFTNVSPIFHVEALAFNLYFLWQAYAYMKNPSVETARSMFRYSIVYLTLLLLLMMWHRQAQPTPLLEIIPTLRMQFFPTEDKTYQTTWMIAE